MMGTADHPMQKIRPLIDTARIRQLCEPLYAETGRPSIPPEQLFLALLGGYLLGVTSERALVRELTGNLVLRWFVGLDLDQMPWDHSTFSQNRKRRFTENGLLERLFDETVALAIKQKLVSHHTTLDGTLVHANASHKSFVPMEVFLQPAEYKRRIRSLDAGPTPDQDSDNPTVTFRGERRSNQTHVSTTDPDAKLANKGNGTAAMVGYTVNGLMDNRLGCCSVSMWSRFEGRPQRRTAGGRCWIGFMRRTIFGFRPWARTRGILRSRF
jgi:transposase